VIKKGDLVQLKNTKEYGIVTKVFQGYYYAIYGVLFVELNSLVPAYNINLVQQKGDI
jgi:hypothetical protein